MNFHLLVWRSLKNRFGREWEDRKQIFVFEYHKFEIIIANFLKSELFAWLLVLRGLTNLILKQPIIILLVPFYKWEN